MSSLNPRNYKLIFPVLLISLFFSTNLTIGANTVEDDLDKKIEQIAQDHAAKQQAKTDKTEKLARKLFRVKHLDINQAKERIQEILTKDEKVGASVEIFTFSKPQGESNFLVVNDTPEKIKTITAIIEDWDKKEAPPKIDLNFSDVELNKIITTIAKTAGLNIIGGEELSQKVTIHLKGIPVKDIFGIILKSTGYSYFKDGEILRIIPEEQLPLVTEVFEFQFISATEVKKVIAHLISEKGSVEVFPKFAKKELSNVLLVTERPDTINRIKAVVEQLDKKLRQVMIEAKICEVTLDKNNEIGIDWVFQASITGANAPTTLPLGLKGKNVPERPGDGVYTYDSTELTTGNISFSTFSATVKALDSKTVVDLISSPRIATSDGFEAKIVIGDRVPIPLYERNYETGTLEITGYQEEDIGVVLKVTPIINKDDTVTLRVEVEVSQSSGATGPNEERPIIATREIKTVFTVEDGKTIVLGGLMEKQVTNTTRKIPILGDIPFFGKLFTFNDDADDRTELLIFITPYILKGTTPQKQMKLTNFDE